MTGPAIRAQNAKAAIAALALLCAVAALAVLATASIPEDRTAAGDARDAVSLEPGPLGR